MLFFLISFIAGVLTVLAPCVLPLLPVIVGGSLSTGSKRRAYTICIALGLSVIIFTLALKASTAFINVPQSAWQYISGGILVLFGVVMIFPRLWDSLGFVNVLNRSSNKALAVGYQKNSFWGDVLMGAALGPVFSSCSPTYFVILATVLPASYLAGFLDLLAYAIGLSGFLFIIALIGQKFVDKLGVAIEPEGWFRRGIGILFLIVGLAVGTGTMARAETWLLNRGLDLTFLEQRLLEGPKPAKCTEEECVGTTSDSTASTSSFDSAQDKSPQVSSSKARSGQAGTLYLSPEMKAGQFPKAHELVAPDGYINTPRSSGQPAPITVGEFKGKKVVLLDIWTYSCINCQRTLPYLKAWYDKYKDQGLEIIGVHTPEFAFEQVYQNVENAVMRFGLKYPVILDNRYQTWNAYGNQFWPRKYLIDIDGYIVYDHAGEGDYDEAERAIQKALAERAARLGGEMPATSIASPEGAVAVGAVRSPETYFGSLRNEYLGNGKAGSPGVQTFTLPANRYGNLLYLEGKWDLTPEYAQSLEKGARIIYSYAAKNVYLVMVSAEGLKIKVTRDGKNLSGERGADVDANGFVMVKEDRLYELIKGADYGEHTIEIEVQGSGLKAYAFTFG